jgi:hypothetical protein
MIVVGSLMMRPPILCGKFLLLIFIRFSIIYIYIFESSFLEKIPLSSFGSQMMIMPLTRL